VASFSIGSLSSSPPLYRTRSAPVRSDSSSFENAKLLGCAGRADGEGDVMQIDDRRWLAALALLAVLVGPLVALVVGLLGPSLNEAAGAHTVSQSSRRRSEVRAERPRVARRDVVVLTSSEKSGPRERERRRRDAAGKHAEPERGPRQAPPGGSSATYAAAPEPAPEPVAAPAATSAGDISGDGNGGTGGGTGQVHGGDGSAPDNGNAGAGGVSGGDDEGEDDEGGDDDGDAGEDDEGEEDEGDD
jgi:hypothetical protein